MKVLLRAGRYPRSASGIRRSAKCQCPRYNTSYNPLENTLKGARQVWDVRFKATEMRPCWRHRRPCCWIARRTACARARRPTAALRKGSCLQQTTQYSGRHTPYKPTYICVARSQHSHRNRSGMTEWRQHHTCAPLKRACNQPPSTHTAHAGCTIRPVVLQSQRELTVHAAMHGCTQALQSKQTMSHGTHP